eukprot:TRINITY_DN21304_c0_g1_i1.p2 TRINITY_DN21304_c0_g1~~TRINITY_DN21304_c0_g1_i1.p2  ORF type:complete len:712 (+),score=301.64 TRINITY_DN21304_c0_g1_i1:112-2136(+)
MSGEPHPAELQRRKGEAGKLFRDLKAAEGDCKRSLTLCDQILRLLPGDPDCVAWRVQTLIRHNRFGDCAKFLEGPQAGPDGRRSCALQLAYAYYRLANEGGNGAAQLARAEEALKGAPDSPSREHLLAQIQFKLAQMTNDDFAPAAKRYAALVRQKATAGVDEDELLCNASAAAICAGDIDSASKVLAKPPSEVTQEMWYNKSCIHVTKREWAEARQCLDSAEKTCRAGYEAEGITDQDAVLDDLAPVRVQRAFVDAQEALARGSGEDVLKRIAQELADVIRRKPSSKATTAVASNNIAALHHDSSLFDAFKRVKPLTEAHFDSKLAQGQRAAIRFNKAILNVRMGNQDQARAEAEKLLRDYPGSHLGPVALAALLCQEKKFGRAEDALRGHLERATVGPEAAAQLRLFLAQIHQQQGNLRAAAACLSEVPHLRHQMATAATVSVAYEAAGDLDAAAGALDTAAQHWRERRSEGDAEAAENLPELLAASAQLKLRHGMWQPAAQTFKELQALRQSPLYQAGLVSSLAHSDVAAAEQAASQLPAVDLPPISPEEAVELLSLKAKEISAAAAASAADKRGQKRKAEEDPKREPKKKKRRRRPKPEGATGEPDPERWLKKKDRASWQAMPKRQRRELRRQRLENRQKRLRAAAHAREEGRERRKEAVEAIRARMKGD